MYLQGKGSQRSQNKKILSRGQSQHPLIKFRIKQDQGAQKSVIKVGWLQIERNKKIKKVLDKTKAL